MSVSLPWRERLRFVWPDALVRRGFLSWPLVSSALRAECDRSFSRLRGPRIIDAYPKFRKATLSQPILAGRPILLDSIGDADLIPEVFYPQRVGANKQSGSAAEASPADGAVGAGAGSWARPAHWEPSSWTARQAAGSVCRVVRRRGVRMRTWPGGATGSGSCSRAVL
jgi:hypothetical protein